MIFVVCCFYMPRVRSDFFKQKHKLMNYFIDDQFYKFKTVGKKLINSRIIEDTAWILLDDSEQKVLYLFKKNNEFFLSTDGNLKKGRWQLVVDQESLIIELTDLSELYNIFILENNFLIIQKDGTNLYNILANYTKFKTITKRNIKLELDNLKKKDIENRNSQVKIFQANNKPIKIQLDRKPIFIQNISTGERRYIAKFEWDELVKKGEAKNFCIID